MVETRADAEFVKLWCANCVNNDQEHTVFCMNCHKRDGEAPTNYLVDSRKPLDSGERTQFFDKDGNAIGVRDMHEGKGRFDLLPWPAIWEVAKHCENGAKKYGEHNVDKGIPIHSLIDSAIRHIVKFWLGWDDEPHLTAACWNLLWALEMCLTKPEMDDRPEVGFLARGVEDDIH